MATMMTDKEVHDAFDEVIVGLEDGTANPAEPKALCLGGWRFYKLKATNGP